MDFKLVCGSLALFVHKGARGWTARVYGLNELDGLNFVAPRIIDDEPSAKMWAIETAKKIFLEDLEESIPDCLLSPVWLSPR